MKLASLLKLAVLGGLSLILLVALLLVGGVISGRQQYRDEAVASIATSYAGPQRLVGPILVQPYRQVVQEVTVDEKGVKKSAARTIDSSYSLFPNELRVTGRLQPSIRRHGLYKVELGTQPAGSSEKV